MAPLARPPVRTTVVASLLLVACSNDGGDLLTPSEPRPPAECLGELCDLPALEGLGLDPFYRKYLDAGGIPVVSSEKVSDDALRAAGATVEAMLGGRPALHDVMVEEGAYVGVMAVTEVTTDIPEHAHLANDPNTDWDQRARGLGGSKGNPITTVGEENLLCLDVDRYGGENILVHEFAHAIHLIGLTTLEPGFDAALRAAFEAAIDAGLWADTYSATNHVEYWAEGVQSWLDVNQAPQEGIHNHVDTRSELVAYDPTLADLVAEGLGPVAPFADCPGA